MNTAGGLNGLLTILKMGAAPDEINELIDRSDAASQVILEDIMSYRQLRAAEEGDIRVKIETAGTIEFLKSAISRISFHEVGKSKEIVIDKEAADVHFQTDRLLFQR